jgi:hypothetical protein
MTAPGAVAEAVAQRLPPPLFWLVELVLLVPLALFWLSVITNSETLTQLLFGATHHVLRDLLSPVILPALALLLALIRLRTLPHTARERRFVLALAALIVASLVVVLGYAVSENLLEAGAR